MLLISAIRVCHVCRVGYSIIIMHDLVLSRILYTVKNVRVILTLSGLAQLHLFRGFCAVKM